MIELLAIEAKYRALSKRLDEASLRMWAAVEAKGLGRGGISAVGRATGLSRTTIHAGLAELKEEERAEEEATGTVEKGGVRLRIRAEGGGRKKLTEKDAELLGDLDALVEPTSRGDPMSPLRWTCKSTYRLAEELKRRGHRVSQRSVCDLLRQLGYRLQSTRKTREGQQHEDRDRQFAHLARAVTEYQEEGEPVISVDAKKKELIGEFKNAGREWQPQGEPEEVRVHDFMEKGKVSP
jgi:transposase